ncbi:MAG: hypothetical protein GX261_01085, partial [Spirochaetales bacterium]|nr:hypothetical protein [Spirochaetales bacterium]
MGSGLAGKIAVDRKWLGNHGTRADVGYHQCSVRYVGLPIPYSTPERMFIELASIIKTREEILQAKVMMEGASNLRPDLLQALLLYRRSVDPQGSVHLLKRVVVLIQKFPSGFPRPKLRCRVYGSIEYQALEDMIQIPFKGKIPTPVVDKGVYLQLMKECGKSKVADVLSSLLSNDQSLLSRQ